MTNFLNWSRLFFDQNNLIDVTLEIQKVRWLMNVIVYTSSLSTNEKYKLIIDCLKDLSSENLKFRVLLLWVYEEFKRKVKSIISYKEYLSKLNS
jgi:hypothetical protein